MLNSPGSSPRYSLGLLSLDVFYLGHLLPGRQQSTFSAFFFFFFNVVLTFRGSRGCSQH